MNRFKALLAVALLTSISFATSIQAAIHYDRIVEEVFNPDTRPCIFFRLSGVPEADPATPGQSWFAVPKSHSGYKEIVATLMIARSTQAPIHSVTTTGAVV